MYSAPAAAGTDHATDYSSERPILLAQNISIHHYHRGLRELNKELAEIKEELRQERKAREILEHKHSEQSPKDRTDLTGNAAFEKLSRDRDVLMEKVATLEAGSPQSNKKFTQFSLWGAMRVTKLSRGGGGTSSYSGISPIGLGIYHQLNDNASATIELRKGSYFGSSELAVHQAFVAFEHQHLRIGRFHLPLTPYSELREAYSVAPSLYDSALAPFGLTADGIAFRLHPKEGIRTTVAVHNGLEADLLDGRSGLQDLRRAGVRSYEKLGMTARVDYQSDTTFGAGLSGIYTGLARSVANVTAANSPAGALMTGILADARVKIIGLQLKAGVAHYNISESEDINNSYRRAIGSAMSGFYVQGAFDFLNLGFETSEKLMVFMRHDRVDSQSSTKGFAKDPRNLRKQTTFGLNYAPARGVMLKADAVILNDDSRATEDDTLIRFGVDFAI